MSRKRLLNIVLLLAVVSTFAIFTTFLWPSLTNQLGARPAELEGVLRAEFSPVQAFELTNHNNEVFDQSIFQDQWSFVFFGYTSCPDVCPNTLSVLSSVQTMLDKQKLPEVQVVFISVDPARDSIELLASYVPYFNKSFIGATAEKAEIDRITQQFGAAYEIESETAGDQYLVAHTSAVFLVDQLGRFVATFSQPHYAKTISSQYGKILSYLNNR